MRSKGRISEWNDERGFGFIQSDADSARVFFHISAVARGAPRPAVGQAVSYRPETSEPGKVRAANVRPLGVSVAPRQLFSRRVLLSLLAAGVLACLWWQTRNTTLPSLVLPIYAVMSCIAFVMYGLDKRAARRDGQRTPENVLQVCALLGGWPGALLAQQVFRHKSRKRSFQIVFWLLVFVNCGVLWLFVSDAGAALLKQAMDRVIAT